ncbi:hypothetical protein NQ176_g8895 [Zarea fungicola]|uniref:Uncharacterized protein n=1 Tax=Zarea fungicola TaxID=93591 RepID=A0ACC1MQP2_9HYPO|nr:hypothetical protein NQ176_g8895 [Lecanicillium fungicola]
MSKRNAVAGPPEASPAKRPYIEDLDSIYSIIDNGDDVETIAQTPSSFTEETDSPVTVATTPRAKFPSDLKTLPCTWPGCPKTFNRPARLRDHLNSHTNSRPFRCTYEGCGKDYIEDKHLKQHIKAVHTNERKHVCQREGCGKSFVTGTRLKRHQAVHEGADRFRCQDCGQSFRKKETLHKHILKEHKGESPHQCDEHGCEAKFESKGALKRHHQRVHGELKYWCSECAMQKGPDGIEKHVGFTTEFLLKAHMKLEHQDCLFCEFKSASQAEMATHIDMHHSGKTVEDRKTFNCDHAGCIKSFTKKSNLRAHQRTAHEGFRFICGEVDLSNVAGLEAWSNADGCSDRFCTKVRLEDHVRYIHLRQERRKDRGKPSQTVHSPAAGVDLIDEISGVQLQVKKAIPCAYCPEAFARYYDLDSHMAAAHTILPEGIFGEQEVLAPFEETGLSFDEMGKMNQDKQDETAAAEMDCEPPRDDWRLEDEAGIMLLARDSPTMDVQIDPALCD